ncbi:hypothetical protein COCCADRAFT_965 [Bipolaris zeicola 26-R-13]|uniref:Uncharacterized protein n=1 Tax=Cochliobolus carbonum (strain 26-R-13) TaxID=930089 RepID=W6YF73_COCC2|nr:uncharacterized protein COCCADRAFT_965 [Bipolaris zeicola 26-R-13]EUC38152.1 hypothetical protein COCCADRAFT_965 [Bipolaris zeicola 26-R-13]
MAARYTFVAFASAAIASAQSTTDDPYYDPIYPSSYSSAPFWTVTARYAEQVTESLYTYGYTRVMTDTYTSTRTIKDDVIPTASPYLVTTSRDWYDTDVQIVASYYTTGVVAESDLVAETTYDWHSTATTTSTTTSTKYSMQVTMTAPASCPTPFTITTTASVSIPTKVTAQISPLSIETGTATGSYGSVIYKYETWYLTASAAPFNPATDYYYDYYIASCSTPPPSLSTGSGSGSGGSSSYYDDCYYCGSYLRNCIIAIAVIIPFFFLCGFLESWFWFRRLMMGRSAMRFGTICWVFISLWILCFTRMQDRRSKEDQKLLAEKWRNMGSGAAFKAWWKWGFRHKYPEELLGQFSKTTVGIVPPGQPLHPEISQTPAAGGPAAPGQVYYYGPPPSGWVRGPNGAFVPPQGYAYPPPQQAGFYGDAAKDGSLVSHSPVSAIGHPPPVHSAQNATHDAPPSAPPSPPPQAPLPTTPVPAPPANVGEAPANTASNQPTAPPPKSDPTNRDLYR